MQAWLRNNITALLVLFASAFLLNWAWEHLHHVLYVHYKGGDITNFILFRAALFDASFIALVFGPFLLIRKLRMYVWIPVLIAFCFAIGLEIYAIQTERWAYRAVMPLVPIVQTGLTPTVQLATLGHIALVSARKYLKS